jgi:RNA recognition motif-containing protein
LFQFESRLVKLIRLGVETRQIRFPRFRFGGVEVRSAQVVVDRQTGRSRGFGFVEMGADSAAQAAIDALHDQEHGGRRLTVNEAKPREDRGGGGGGGRGGYRGGGGGGGGGW